MKRKSPDRIKANGIHYTPPELARFLADVMVGQLSANGDRIHVLDPACGDGALLHAFAMSVSPKIRKRLILTGYEMDTAAISDAASVLRTCGVAEVVLRSEDFLAVEGTAHNQQRSFSFDAAPEHCRFDAVIANPPYVRTQTLGAKTAQALASRFGLAGRVDLYHAFTRAMANVLKPNGVLGLLTSNRFLTTRAGETLRRLLRSEFALQAVYDLGDTKLFSAAVLPAIVVALKRPTMRADDGKCSFTRVYESRGPNGSACAEAPHVLHALRGTPRGAIKTPSGVFHIEHGVLSTTTDVGATWSLSTPAYNQWLKTVRTNQAHTFDAIALIRVGLKTTADDIFVRRDWSDLPPQQRPEKELVHPLITHYDADRWRLSWSPRRRSVLYPYAIGSPRKQPIRLADYPRTQAYFAEHAERLKRRSYVVDSGRQWYEIWVPQIPSEWSKPKIVFPDISETPKFCLDRTGALVQGDCYWITLKEGADQRWLFVMLAVANSTFITKYYDVAFHNKLYSGRRRFMTQYVKTFPLPDMESRPVRRLIQLASQLADGAGDSDSLDNECDQLVSEAFGLS